MANVRSLEALSNSRQIVSRTALFDIVGRAHYLVGPPVPVKCSNAHAQLHEVMRGCPGSDQSEARPNGHSKELIHGTLQKEDTVSHTQEQRSRRTRSSSCERSGIHGQKVREA
jgi:hypothetical protein